MRVRVYTYNHAVIGRRFRQRVYVCVHYRGSKEKLWVVADVVRISIVGQRI